MFRTLADFFDVYRSLNEGTLRLFDALSDANMHQSVAPGYRTLRHIAWHIVVTVPEMTGRTGLSLSSLDPDAPPPDSADAIRDGYRRVSSELVDAIRAAWTDETLQESDEMYGETWKRGGTLFALYAHEVHHRAEMVVLLRQAGAAVPGLMGPSKEEWSQYGMEPPAY